MRTYRIHVGLPDQPRMKARANELGLPVSAYLRGLIEMDLGMNPSGDLNDLNDPPNLNTGDLWLQSEEYDIAYGAKHGDSVEELAELLCRTKREIAETARAMGYENIPMWRNRRPPR